MKSTLIEAEVKKPEIKFPCIAKSKDGNIVLFTNSTCGTVVANDLSFTNCLPLGSYLEHWLDINRQDIWTILPPGTKVELIQE
jgi:hypothetical protein